MKKITENIVEIEKKARNIFLANPEERKYLSEVIEESFKDQSEESKRKLQEIIKNYPFINKLNDRFNEAQKSRQFQLYRSSLNSLLLYDKLVSFIQETLKQRYNNLSQSKIVIETRADDLLLLDAYFGWFSQIVTEKEINSDKKLMESFLSSFDELKKEKNRYDWGKTEDLLNEKTTFLQEVAKKEVSEFWDNSNLSERKEDVLGTNWEDNFNDKIGSEIEFEKERLKDLISGAKAISTTSAEKKDAIDNIEIIMNQAPTITNEELLNKLRVEGKLTASDSDWRNYINDADATNFEQRKEKINSALAELKRENIIADLQAQLAKAEQSRLEAEEKLKKEQENSTNLTKELDAERDRSANLEGDYKFSLDINSSLQEKIDLLDKDLAAKANYVAPEQLKIAEDNLKKSLEVLGREIYKGSFFRSSIDSLFFRPTECRVTEDDILDVYEREGKNDLEEDLKHLTLTESMTAKDFVEAMIIVASLEKGHKFGKKIISNSSDTRSRVIADLVKALSVDSERLEKSKQKIKQVENKEKHALHLNSLEEANINKLLLDNQEAIDILNKIVDFRTGFKVEGTAAAAAPRNEADAYQNKGLTAQQAAALYNATPRIAAVEVNNGIVDFAGKQYDVTNQLEVAALQAAKVSASLHASQTVPVPAWAPPTVT